MKRRVRRHEVTQPLDQSYRLIPLSQGKNAIVDAEDFERINQWNWSASSYRGKFRACRFTERNGRPTFMHHVILGIPHDTMIDHKSGDGLDNRKQNLRRCSNQQNSFNKGMYSTNTSGFKGVVLDKTSRKWKAQITVNGKGFSIGRFKTAEAAALAYDEAAKVVHGTFARTNF